MTIRLFIQIQEKGHGCEKPVIARSRGDFMQEPRRSNLQILEYLTSMKDCFVAPPTLALLLLAMTA
ncbi:hypothetical protein [Chitinophaga barathri]|uniref:Uncharacterized protein n=1 Tax=Chitinophaga barathri TaxID=1647451 RepID=A0A3N4MPV9_9BACT|nr:hypothetical protein [Chitinophaga barathri]RPD42130.1 hypothetical protein EG028_08285 [Chitinophaga barathri]